MTRETSCGAECLGVIQTDLDGVQEDTFDDARSIFTLVMIDRCGWRRRPSDGLPWRRDHEGAIERLPQLEHASRLQGYRLCSAHDRQKRLG